MSDDELRDLLLSAPTTSGTDRRWFPLLAGIMAACGG